MDWEDEKKESMRRKLEGSEKSSLKIVNNELDLKFFIFLGTDSLYRGIGRKEVTILSTTTNENELSAAKLYTLDEPFCSMVEELVAEDFENL